MTLIQFIRLVVRNIWLLLGFPLVLAVLVFVLTRDGKRTYRSQTVIYTAVNSSESATLGEAMKIDFYTANNQFDNLIFLVKSRNTAQNAGIKLLADHISLKEADPSILLPEHYEELKNQLGEVEWAKYQVVGNPAETYNKIIASLKKDQQSALFYVLNNHRHYSIDKIQEKLSVRRRESSDMLEISFESDDPGVAQRTLKHINESFDERHREIKGAQNSSAIAYFEEQLAIAEKNLRVSENKFRDFMADNRILNYYEQGKYLDITRLEIENDVEQAEKKIRGTQENMKQLDAMMSQGAKRSQLVDSMLTKRKVYNEIEAKLQSLQTKPQAKDDRQLVTLNNELSIVKKEIDDYLAKIYSFESSKEGIPRKAIMEAYVENLLEKKSNEEAKNIVADRKTAIEKEMDAFAPLGATLKSLEREVDINEEIYLTILHNLHQARLKKEKLLKDNEGGNVIDPPFYPLRPEKSKRLFVILGSLVGSFFLILSFLIAKTLLDRRIRTLLRAEKLTNHQVQGLFPFHDVKNKKVDFGAIESISAEQLFGRIQLNLNQKRKEGASLILICSNQSGEGKSHVGNIVSSILIKSGAKTLFLTQNHIEADKSDLNSILNFKVESNYLSIQNFDSIIPENARSEYDYILLELPSFLNNSFPVDAVATADYSLFVVNAKRIWAHSDARILELFENASKKSISLVLNSLDVDDLEEVVGEIPKKRSKFRLLIKRLLRL